MSLWKYKYFLDVVELKSFTKGRSKKLCNTDGSKSADRLFGKKWREGLCWREAMVRSA